MSRSQMHLLFSENFKYEAKQAKSPQSKDDDEVINITQTLLFTLAGEAQRPD